MIELFGLLSDFKLDNNDKIASTSEEKILYYNE